MLRLTIELKCVEEAPKEDKLEPIAVPPSTTITAAMGVGSTVRTTTTRVRDQLVNDQQEDDEDQEERILPVLPPAVQAIPSTPPVPTTPPSRRQQFQPQPPFARPTEAVPVSPRLTSPSSPHR